MQLFLGSADFVFFFFLGFTIQNWKILSKIIESLVRLQLLAWSYKMETCKMSNNGNIWKEKKTIENKWGIKDQLPLILFYNSKSLDHG